MRVMIIGAHPSGNKGAEAMLLILTNKLSEKFSGIEFVFESVNGKENYAYFSEKGYNYRTIVFNPKKIFSPYSSSLSDIDCVIDIGGLAYTDKSIKNNLRVFIKHFSIMLRRKKLIFFTQDCGPAKRLNTKFFGKIIFSMSKLIFTRSQFSYDTLINDFKVSKEKILGPYPDSTLVFSDGEIKNPINEKNYVVISPSAILYNQEKEKYLDLLNKLIDAISVKYKVFLLVHTFTSNGASSDANVIDKLLSNNKNAEKVNLNTNPIILKKILSDAKVVVSSRYHVIVGSMSSDVPAIAIGWNEKYKSFLSLYDMAEYNIQFDESSFDVILNLLKTIDQNELQLKEKINKTNNTLKRRVAKSFDLLCNHIKL